LHVHRWLLVLASPQAATYISISNARVSPAASHRNTVGSVNTWAVLTAVTSGSSECSWPSMSVWQQAASTQQRRGGCSRLWCRTAAGQPARAAGQPLSHHWRTCMLLCVAKSKVCLQQDHCCSRTAASSCTAAIHCAVLCCAVCCTAFDCWVPCVACGAHLVMVAREQQQRLGPARQLPQHLIQGDHWQVAALVPPVPCGIGPGSTCSWSCGDSAGTVGMCTRD
jgi:hypothetical protein